MPCRAISSKSRVIPSLLTFPFNHSHHTPGRADTGGWANPCSRSLSFAAPKVGNREISPTRSHQFPETKRWVAFASLGFFMATSGQHHTRSAIPDGGNTSSTLEGVLRFVQFFENFATRLVGDEVENPARTFSRTTTFLGKSGYGPLVPFGWHQESQRSSIRQRGRCRAALQEFAARVIR